MNSENKCLMYPVLQKYYNALVHLKELRPESNIFEIIPKLMHFYLNLET